MIFPINFFRFGLPIPRIVCIEEYRSMKMIKILEIFLIITQTFRIAGVASYISFICVVKITDILSRNPVKVSVKEAILSNISPAPATQSSILKFTKEKHAASAGCGVNTTTINVRIITVKKILVNIFFIVLISRTYWECLAGLYFP
jgi:hypothetical protein